MTGSTPPPPPSRSPPPAFPGSVAALRTLKSDVVVGLTSAVETALDAAEGHRWRTGGTHALIQARR